MVFFSLNQSPNQNLNNGPKKPIKKELPFRIVCTPADYDNMGQILDELGFPFRTYDLAELNAKESMQNVDVLFINCQGPEPTWQAANNVREMVSRGGALYVSCYAHKWIDMIFPGKLEFHGDGEIQQALPVRIIEPKLTTFLGIDEFELNMNTHWHGIKKIIAKEGPESVKVYIVGKRQGWYEEEPMLVSFPYDDGFVIFTSFHNSHQVGELEKRLLQYLVIQPLMARKSRQANEILYTRRYVPTKEILGALRPGEESKPYPFDLLKPHALKCVINWEGKAVTQLKITAPTGEIVFNKKLRTSPFELDIPHAIEGRWTIQMKIVDAPMRTFPFVIHIGLKDILEQKLEESAPTEIQSNATRVIPITPLEEDTQSINKQQTQKINKQQTQKINKQQIQKINQQQTQKINQQQELNGNLLLKQDLDENNLMEFTLEELMPNRQIIGYLTLSKKKPLEFIAEYVPDLDIENNINKNPILFTLQITNSNQIAIKSNEKIPIEAAGFKGEEYKTLPLIPNVAIAYQFPVIIKIDNKVLLGLYPKG